MEELPESGQGYIYMLNSVGRISSLYVHKLIVASDNGSARTKSMW